MNQKAIVEGLQKALAGGNGSLDDLDALLVRARSDIEQAKKDEAAAAEKAKENRANEIAKMATRILNKEMTAADMALVMNTWFEQNDLQAVWTEDNINSLTKECDMHTKECINKTNSALKDLCEVLNDTFHLDLDPKDMEIKRVNKKEKSADDVINDFLKKFGLA